MKDNNGPSMECHTMRTADGLQELLKVLHQIRDRIESKKIYYHGPLPPSGPISGDKQNIKAEPSGVVAIIRARLSDAHALANEIADSLQSLEEV